MKLKSIGFENEQPAVVTVELTVGEAALITKLLGRKSPNDLTDEGLGGYHAEQNAICNGFTGWLFNPYWENGVEEL